MDDEINEENINSTLQGLKDTLKEVIDILKDETKK